MRESAAPIVRCRAMGAAQSGDFEPNLFDCVIDHGADDDSRRRKFRDVDTDTLYSPNSSTLSPGSLLGREKGATMVPGERRPAAAAVSQVTEHTHPPGAGATPSGEKRATMDPGGRRPAAVSQVTEHTHTPGAGATPSGLPTGAYRPKSTLEVLPPTPKRFGSGDASPLNVQGGVGLVLQKTDAGQFQVVKMVRDGPAHRSCRISKGDTLVKVNGQTLVDPLSHLSGPANTNVELSFQKDNGGVEAVSLTRDAACFPDEMEFHVQRRGVTSTIVRPSKAALARPQQELAALERAAVPYVSDYTGEEVSMTLPAREYGNLERAAVPYVSDYSGEEVSMTLPSREYGNSNVGYSRDGSTVTLPPIDYSEYKKREMQGQIPEMGKYVPKEPSRIEEAYAEFLRSDDLSTHIPYEASKSHASYTVVSSSNGNALRIERDASSSLNHRADYSQDGSYQVAQAPERKSGRIVLPK